MKFLAALFCGLIAAGVAQPARADAFGPEMGYWSFILVQAQGQAPDQAQGQGQRRGADRPMPQRGARAAERDERGRMSPEERHQLRRDIRDAGRDIYRPGRSAPAGRRQPGRR
jgi:hypothetical protein